MPAFVKALNNVDFPTFGKPTIPHFKLMAAFQGQAGPRMRWLAAVAAAWLVLACAAHAAAPPHPTIALSDTVMQVDAQEIATVWVDPRGSATIDQITQGGGGAAFQPGHADQIVSLGESGQLWMHWRVSRARNAENGWVLNFPMPALEMVTVYQQNDKGQWVGQSAGDTIAVATWPEPGRYPRFRLELPAGHARAVYARIRHLTPANFPKHQHTEATNNEHIQLEYLGLGLSFGAMLLLIIACLAQALVYRDSVYAWYAGYAFVTTMGMASYTGAAAHLLWPGCGALGDAPQGMLALLAGASAILFVRNLIGISGRHHFIDKLVLGMGIAGVALACLFPIFPKAIGLAVVGVYIAGATIINLWIAFDAWRRSAQ